MQLGGVFTRVAVVKSNILKSEDYSKPHETDLILSECFEMLIEIGSEADIFLEAS